MATHNLIATVSSVTGEVFVRNSEGQLQQLKVGDQLSQGDVVIPSNGGSVELTMADGSTMTLDQPVEVTLSQEMLADEQPAAQDDAITDESVAAVLEALESGGDPTAVLPPPTAGAAADEGHDFIRLTRIVEELTPSAFPGDALASADDDLLSPDLLDQENDAPVLDLDANDDHDNSNSVNYQTTFTEGSDPVAIADLDSMITDVDDNHIESATITLTNAQDGDVLVVGDLPDGITAVVTSDDVTLSGSATLDNYEAAIEAITFSNTSDDPDTTDRIIEVVVNDGTDDSAPAITTISVIPVNDPPELDLDENDDHDSSDTVNYQTTFTEGGGPVAIADLDSLITDPDDSHIESATITLTNAQDGDELVVGDLPDGITAVITGDDVTLSGSATLDNYEAAIEAITFSNTSDDPDTTDRIIEVVVNDGTDDSDPAITTISVIPVNDAPVARDNSYDVNEEGGVGGNIIIDNTGDGVDSDEEGDSLRIASVNVNGEAVEFDSEGNAEVTVGDGVLTIYGDGTFNYEHNGNEPDEQVVTSFDYTITDGDLESNTATVMFNVQQFNDAPVAVNNSYDLNEGGGVGGNIIIDDTGVGVDSDEEGDSLSIATVNGEAVELSEGNAEVTVGDGILTINGDGTFNYEHNGEEPAETSFTYTVSDGELESNTATVTLNVAPVNDPPTIDVTANDFVEGDESNIEGVVAGTYTTDDVDGDNLTVAFTEGTNSEGYYALDADNNQVTLTQAGVGQVNSGGDLSPIDLTVTDDGDPNLTGRDADTPGVDSLVHLDMPVSGGTVYDEGLLPDSENSATTIGSFTITAPDGLASVTIAGTDWTVAQLESNPLEVINNGDETLVITGFSVDSDTDIYTISYSYTLLEAVSHDPLSDVDEVSFQVTATDQDGSVSEPADLVITQIDDAPVIHSITDGIGLNDAGVINGLLEVKTSADDPVVFNWNAGDVVITNSEGGPITLYAEGQLVEISPPDDETQTITGTAGGETVFTLTLSEDFSSYIYEQYMPVAVLVEDVAILGDLTGGNSETFHFQATAGPVEAPLVTTFYGFEFDPDAGVDGAFAASTVNTSSQSMGVGTGQNIDDDGDAEDHLFISFDGGLVTEFSFSLIDPGNKGEDLWYIAYTADDLPFDLDALDDEGFSYQESDLTGDRTTLEVGSILSDGSETLTFEEPIVFIVFGSDSESGGSSYKLVPNSLTADYFSEELTFNLSAPFTLTDEDSDSTSDSIEISIIGNGDNLTGNEFDNALGGNERANTLTGGEGNDVLTGGKGDDTLIGDDPLTDSLGSDTFVWQLNDGGSTGDPAVDLITDFDDGLPASDGDILDLRDLLIGEEGGDLTEFLHFSSDGTDSVLHISSSGGFAGDELDTTVVDQVIEFNGVDLVGDLTTQNEIIENLLGNGNLITD